MAHQTIVITLLDHQTILATLLSGFSPFAFVIKKYYLHDKQIVFFIQIKKLYIYIHFKCNRKIEILNISFENIKN